MKLGVSGGLVKRNTYNDRDYNNCEYNDWEAFA